MKLTVACLTRNAAEGYAPSAISAFRDFADDVAILEDKDGEMWGSESEWRKRLWDMALDTNPDWIMILDDDMIPLKDPRPLMREGIDAVAFTLYDLWGANPLVYRADQFWQAHRSPRVWAVRAPRDEFRADWNHRGIHTGHFPANLPIQRAILAPNDYSLLHFAYLTHEQRVSKHWQYLSKQDQLAPAELAHAESIISANPNTVKLPHEPTWILTKSESS